MTLAYMDRLQEIADEDIRVLKVKDAEYGGSWKKRGGVGAYMMFARKTDRLEVAVKRHNYDVFVAATADTREEGILDDIRDARRYLALIEAEILERRPSIPCYTGPSIELDGQEHPFGYNAVGETVPI